MWTRASHHLWTNLPSPDQGFYRLTQGTFAPARCLDRYRQVPHRPVLNAGDPSNPSQILEHVIAQLMFDFRYEQAASSCREFSIHWGAPSNVCEQLAKDPARVLDDTHAQEPVDTVLERYALTQEVQAFATPHPVLTQNGSRQTPQAAKRKTTPWVKCHLCSTW
ncbi:MAG: hypothetical protein R3C68_00500 [Myxococcota bacterium]